MDSDLYWAAVAGNIDCITSSSERVNQVSSDGNHTILHLASQFGQKDCVSHIVDKFPHLLNQLNSKNVTALHRAASRGHTHVVDILISKSRGFDSDSGRGWQFFIRRGNVDFDTALHLAVRNNQLGVVKLLVEADPSDRHSRNLRFETPLYLAAIGGYKDLVREILETCTSPTFDGPQGRIALHAAVISRDLDCVKLILQRTDLLHIADNKGWTAKHYAAYHDCGSILDIVEIENYIAIPEGDSKQRHMATTTKKTALHIATYEGHISMVTQLMKYYPDSCAAVDEDGRNILHIAAMRKHTELVECILQDCADINNLLNVPDKAGNTPLQLLVVAGCFVPQLIQHVRVNRSARNNVYFTPFDLLYFHEDIVADQLLIKKAFEDVEGNEKWKMWLKEFNIQNHSWNFRQSVNAIVYKTWHYLIQNSGLESNEGESSVHRSKRNRKDAKFKIAKAKMMKEEIELYRERTNTHIIITALITTVTFTVGFTMPGGYHQSGEKDEGLAILSKQKAFEMFMIADTTALVCSATSLFLYFISSMYQDPHQVSKLIAQSTKLNLISIVTMMLTFMTGTYVMLPQTSSLVPTVFIICSIFFLYVVFYYYKMMYDKIDIY